MGELVFFIKNYQYQSTIQIQAQLISPQCWDVDPNDYDKHDLTNSYPGGLSTRTLPPSQNYAQWIAFDLCFSRDLLEPYLGLGKYQITVYEIVGGVYFPKATMTVDYRTSHLPEAVWGGTGVSPDLYFDYDDLTDKLYYAHTTVQPVDVRIWDKQGINFRVILNSFGIIPSLQIIEQVMQFIVERQLDHIKKLLHFQKTLLVIQIKIQ